MWVKKRLNNTTVVSTELLTALAFLKRPAVNTDRTSAVWFTLHHMAFSHYSIVNNGHVLHPFVMLKDFKRKSSFSFCSSAQVTGRCDALILCDDTRQSVTSRGLMEASFDVQMQTCVRTYITEGTKQMSALVFCSWKNTNSDFFFFLSDSRRLYGTAVCSCDMILWRKRKSRADIF